MTTTAPYRTLNDGGILPAIGYGTGFLDDTNAPEMVAHALEHGYRLLDTAARYGNEVGVGEGVRQARVDRKEIVVTTKLRGSEHGRDEARRALEGSLSRLGLDWVDLYLIHWPLPRLDRYVDSWRTMIEMRAEGLIRSIGVSNFLPEHIERLERETGVLPAVNQIERHLEWPQTELNTYNAARGIATEAWSPLRRAGTVLESPELAAVATKHGVTPAQVALRWHIQNGVTPIPYSSNRERIASNFDVFSFELSDDDLAALARLDTGDRFGGDPNTHEEL